ncbi:TKL family protein kinase [Tritrichomonas foetus]|uniref:TKL family protein kinase n=1 Tax=Tritrichomonas foetus TaxID=1144522 RepID=A0A1J4K606_9EUKA|nr:TKL family protein kinase [Tritrichomonas foetus]|eukprot:OHT06847.1 TKL family protein kinase [Tritrichomonas foetus]
MESDIQTIAANIKLLQSMELVVYVHCSKINSLSQCLKQASALLHNLPPRSIKSKQITTVATILSLLDHTKQLFINCGRNVCLNFVLITSLNNVLTEFMQIRKDFSVNFSNLGYPEVAALFEISENELLLQNNVDLKRIFQFIVQLRKRQGIDKRPDVLEKMASRLKSINGSNLQISAEDSEFIALPPLPNRLDLIISRRDLELGPQIGSGQSGSVYKGVFISQEKQVAIKVLNCNNIDGNDINTTSRESAAFRREVSTLASLSHPSIIELIGYTDEKPFCIVTELLTSSLRARLKSESSKLTASERMIIAIDVARGLEYLHERNIIHRDLKSLNVLLDNRNRAKICDFGLSRIRSNILSVPLTGNIGTTPWMAPEVLMSSPVYDTRVDIYSYGILLWELLTCDVPYRGIPTEKLINKVLNDNLRPIIPENTPKRLERLITTCWDSNPSKRPTMPEILHNFVSPLCCFPGADLNYVLRQTNLQRRHTPSISDPAKMLEEISLSALREASKKSNKGNLYTLETYTELENSVALNRTIEKMRRIIKTGVIPPEMLTDLIKAVNVAKPAYVPRLLMLLSEIVTLPNKMTEFIQQNGAELICKLLSSDDCSAAEATLMFLNSRLCSSLSTVDIIRELLMFSSNDNHQFRQRAIELLLRMIDLRFDYLASLPTFNIHFLTFTLKPISSPLLIRLLKASIKLVNAAPSIPDEIVPQIVWLCSNCSETDLVLDLLESAFKFDNVPLLLEYDIWKVSAEKLPERSIFFTYYMNHNTPNLPDMIKALMESSDANDEALKLLITFSNNSRIAEIIVQYLPIKAKRKPVLVFQLYKSLISQDFCLDPVSHQVEFYVVCKDLLMTEHQAVVCSTVREVPINVKIIEKSGLQTRLVEMFLETQSYDSLWNIMSVIFTFCENNRFVAFRLLCSKLSELLRSDDEKIRLSSFLCLTNVIEPTSFGVDYFWYLKDAAEFSNSPLLSVQSKSLFVIKNYLSQCRNKINDIVDVFLLNFRCKNEISSEIAQIFLTNDTENDINPENIHKLNQIA